MKYVHKITRTGKGKLAITALVCIFWICLIAITALAAPISGFSVTGLSAASSGDSQGYWSAPTTNSLVGSVSGEDAGSGCGSQPKSHTTTMTFTNTGYEEGQISFGYKVSGSGTVTIAGTTVTGQGTHTVTLSKNATLAIVLTSNTGASSTINIDITDISFVERKSVTMTFKAPSGNGTYTVTGTNYSKSIDSSTADSQNTQDATESYTLIATPTNSSYKLQGWYSETEGKYLSASLEWNTYFGSDTSVYPVFISKETPVWAVGDQWFTELNTALGFAETNSIKLITLISDGSLAAGTYEVKNGYTLLIPMDSAGTNFTSADYDEETDDGITYNSTPAVSDYRVLTMSSGATINVSGTINVAGRFSAKGQSGGYNGTPRGPHGKIVMPSGSAINIKSGGTMYAFGYITGDNKTSDKTKGTVTVESGASVHECFQIKDFRGGTATSGMVGNSSRVFPFNQYYVQNIEVPLTIYAGANEYVYSGVFMTTTKLGITVTYKVPTGSVPFIGSAGLFQISTGHITRTYLSSEDRVCYDVYGDITLGGISLKVYVDINSADYVLPINENMEVSLHSYSSGTSVGYSTATVKQDIALLPGTKVNIDSGCTLNIASGYNCFLYDTADWSNSYFISSTIYPLDYTAATRGARPTPASALIDVNGIVNVAGGLYTTTNGAQIISTEGTGRVEYSTAAGTQTTTKQATQSGSTISYSSVAITSAKLKNAVENPSYTETAGSTSGDVYIYSSGLWGKPITITLNPGTGGNGTMSSIETVSGATVLLPSLEEAANAFTRDGYKITGWNTTADGSGVAYNLGSSAMFSTDVTLYAQWRLAGLKISFQKGADSATGTMPDQSFESDATSVTLSKCSFSYDRYAFTGWKDQDGVSYEDEQVLAGDTFPTKDLTMTAQWERVGYTITYKNGGGSGTDVTQNYDKRVTFTLTANNNHFTRLNYKFLGWSETEGATAATYSDKQFIPAGTLAKDATLYAVWQELPKIVFNYNYDGGPSANTIHVNQSNQCEMITPSRTGYRFDGWAESTDGEVKYQGNIKYTFTADTNLYAQWTKEVTITFKANDMEATPQTDTSIKGYEGESVTLAGNVYSHSYYELLGWDTDSTKTSDPMYSLNQTIDTPADNLTLYAVWRKPVYDVTITWSPLTYTYEKVFTWDPVQMKYTETGSGWSYTPNGGTPNSSGAAITVTNNAEDSLPRVSATITYTAESAYSGVISMKYGKTPGAFDNTLGTFTSTVLYAGGVKEQTIFLMLDGEPNADLNSTTVGKVSVTLQKVPWKTEG